MLCRKPCRTRSPATTPYGCRESRGRSPRLRRKSSSRSPSRDGQIYRSSSRHSNTSHSPSQDHHRRRLLCRRKCTPTPHRHQVSHMSFNPNTACNEGQLYTDLAPDGQRSFHATLQMVTKQGCKCLPVKVDPGADINTIPLSHSKTIFLQHFTKDGHLKKNVLRSTTSTWSPHNSRKKQFMGFFTIDIQHNTSPKLAPLSFYILKIQQTPVCYYPILLLFTWV